MLWSTPHSSGERSDFLSVRVNTNRRKRIEQKKWVTYCHDGPMSLIDCLLISNNLKLIGWLLNKQ